MNIPRLLLRLLLGRRLPITTGELRIHGPHAPITIRRDKHGVPHADTDSEYDAYFAFGFCQAQDRAAQLEFLWRIGRGRLAEWVGAAGLGADRLSRRIGFRRAAEQQLPKLAEPIRQYLVAFAAGVTAGNSVGLSAKPHEFAILGGEPSPWDAADVLCILKLQSMLLPSNWDVELARLRILLADGADAMTRLDPSGPLSTEYQLRQPPSRMDDPLNELVSDLAVLQTYLPRGGGSNNWAIAGSRTISGSPILASDPHLAPIAPPPWYLVHVRCPEWEVAGAAFVGTPGIGIGHNGTIAWGVTAALTDNTDLFLETLASDGRSVREADGQFTPCELFREVIHVKGGGDHCEDVFVTPRGPLLTPILDDIPHALSLRAVWLDPLPVSGFLGAMGAKSFEEFRKPFEHWPFFPLNVVYADIHGTIAWQVVGQAPRRVGYAGVLPVPADHPGIRWQGLLPYDELPAVVNPESGFCATANNAPEITMAATRQGADSRDKTVDEYSKLGVDYCDSYRIRAILEALTARTGWTLAECLTLQQDVRSLPWEEIRASVLSLTPTDADAREALTLLGKWDGRVDSESPAATIFELFTAEMCVRIAQVAAPQTWQVALGEAGLGATGHNLFTDRRIAHLVNLIRNQPPGWFDSWSDEFTDALSTVVKKLRREVGPSPAYWAWGHLRRLRLDHQLFAKHRFFGPIFNIGPVPCGGDCNTISQAGVRPAEPTAFTHNMANMRTVFDLSDLSRSLFVLCGGQSGNPCSPHFEDQLPLWQAGEAITIPWLQAAVIREAKQVLKLIPAS
jgi:penicillin amidase